MTYTEAIDRFIQAMGIDATYEFENHHFVKIMYGGRDVKISILSIAVDHDLTYSGIRCYDELVSMVRHYLNDEPFDESWMA